MKKILLFPIALILFILYVLFALLLFGVDWIERELRKCE